MAEPAQQESGPSDPWGRLGSAIDDYNTAVEKEEAGTLDTEGGDRSPTDLKPGLDTSYWRLMTDQVSGLVLNDLPENLTFDERLLYALNYGILQGHPAMAWAAERVAPFMPTPPKHPRFECVYVSETLNRKYRDILKVDVINNLNKDLERIRKAMDDAPGEREAAIKRRDHAIETGVNAPSDQGKLKSLFSQIDSELETIKTMERKQVRGGFSGKEERQKFISLTQMRDQRNEEINYILERYGEAGQEIHRQNHEADQWLETLMELRDEKRDKEKEIDREKGAVHSISVIDVKAGLEEAVGGLKGNGRLTSKLGKSMQVSMPLEERDLVTPDKAYAALDEILEYDPNLFNNRGVKRKGQPQLFIMPGIGEGVYDWEGNRLLIPVMYTRSVLASVASAVVLYRVDVDQSYNEREMILSYKNDIKEHKKIRSMIKLRQQLIKDYMLWVTKEAKGFPLMEKPNRLWFEYRIGPNKYNPKFPIDMLGLSMKQQREGLEAEMAKPESLETLYRQALYWFMMEEDNTEMLQKETVPRLEKCYEMDPNHLDVIYSLGAVLRKVKNKKCIDILVEYTRKAPQSWWSKKATELVNTFK